MGPMTLLSLVLALYALTHRVTISPHDLRCRTLGIDYASVQWADLRTAYRAPIHDSLVLVPKKGRKIRISIYLDGLSALAECLCKHTPGVADRSFIDWTLHKLYNDAPEPDCPPSSRP
jgi:hypothetical protein